MTEVIAPSQSSVLPPPVRPEIPTHRTPLPLRETRGYAIRHAKYDYGQPHALLSEDGVRDTVTFTDEFVTDQVRPYLDQINAIITLASSSPRTLQTARVMNHRIRDIAYTEGWTDTRITPVIVTPELNTTHHTLGPLVKAGIPLELAINMWLTLPEEQIREYGSIPPREIYERINQRLSAISPEGGKKHKPIRLVAAVTHETAIASFLHQHFTRTFPPKRPDYLEPLEVRLTTDGTHMKFRDEVVIIK